MATSRPRPRNAEQTRQRICDAAKDLFLTRGYASTTITDIARAAGVAHQTVYFAFGSKAAVLAAVMDAEIVGDSAAVPLLQRPVVRRIAEIPDPARRLEPLVALACDITSRVAPLYEIVRSGAADEQIRQLLERHEDQRWHTLRAFVDLLGPARADGGPPEQATDRLFALLSHEVYWLLVVRRNWSLQQWRDHVSGEAARQLFGPGTPDTLRPARS